MGIACVRSTLCVTKCTHGSPRSSSDSWKRRAVGASCRMARPRPARPIEGGVARDAARDDAPKATASCETIQVVRLAVLSLARCARQSTACSSASACVERTEWASAARTTTASGGAWSAARVGMGSSPASVARRAAAIGETQSKRLLTGWSAAGGASPSSSVLASRTLCQLVTYARLAI
eukprot:2829596-Pleurochrysis_carterae.AAC.1